MISATIKDYINEQKKLNGSDLFISDAAEKAKYITCVTHPCQFSHPKANKPCTITPIVFYGAQSDDGYMRSGNVKSEQRIDMYGSAGFAAVMKFLALNMSNGKTVLENISDNTPEANELLSSSGRPADELREQFLEVFKGDKQSENTQVTSSKIKQVFFPKDKDGEGQYHLLSLLTPSPLVYEMKKRLSTMMEDARNKKELIKKGELTDSFLEIFDLTTLKYGGTKPQNISQLNTENGGITWLLPSIPPILEYHRTRLPKRDFFAECLNKHDFIWVLDGLFKLITLPKSTPITLEKQRKYRDRLFTEIVLTITEKVFAVREAFKEMPDTLQSSQQVWLSKDETVRLNTNDWKNDIVDDMAHWIIANLKKDHPVELGDAELSKIKDTLTKLEDYWK